MSLVCLYSKMCTIIVLRLQLKYLGSTLTSLTLAQLLVKKGTKQHEPGRRLEPLTVCPKQHGTRQNKVRSLTPD